MKELIKYLNKFFKKNVITTFIPSIPDKIIRSVQNGLLVIFVGNGVSRILGYPSWKELSFSILKSCYERKLIDKSCYKEFSSYSPRKLLSMVYNIYLDKNKKNNFFEDFNNGLNPKSNDKHKIYEDIYKLIYDFNAIYVTTNYDNLLDSCCVDQSKIIYERGDFLRTYLDSGYIFHLHGCIKNPESLVITIYDYLKLYSKEAIRKFLKELFNNHTLLFIGYGLEELELLEFIIRENDSNFTNREPDHYILYPISKKEEILFSYLENYYKKMNIGLIKYYIGNDKYESLYYILKEWNKEIPKYSRSKKFLDKTKIIDEVL